MIIFITTEKFLDLDLFVHYSGNMDIKEAIIIFNTLSQETRLNVFRLLVKAGSEGISAGVISKKLGTPHNTMSFHLNHLSNANIIKSCKEGRSIFYSANYEVIQSLIGFIVRDCCREDFVNIEDDKDYSIIKLSKCC